MQSVLSPASDAQFRQANSSIGGWALVLVVSLASFLVHVQPGQTMAAEQAAQGLVLIGATAALAHGAADRLTHEAGQVNATQEQRRDSNPLRPAVHTVHVPAAPGLQQPAAL